MARRRRSNPFSLFAFQDIITSVMGIMLLSALLLAVELVMQKAPAAVFDGGSKATQVRMIAMIDDVEVDLKRLNDEFEIATNEAVEAASTVIVDAPRQLESARERRDRALEQSSELDRLLEETRRREAKARASIIDRRADVERLSEMRRESERLKSELKRLRQGSHLFFRPAPGLDRAIWLIDLSADRILFGPLPPNAQDAVPQVSNRFDGVAELRKHLSTLPAAKNYFVVLIRPSGASSYCELVEPLYAKGYSLGFDVIAEGRQVFAEDQTQ